MTRFLCVLLLVGLVAGPPSMEKGRVSRLPTTDRLATDAEAPGGRPIPVDHRSDPPPATFGRIAPIVAAGRITGTATWCAPTPRYCKGWGGKAMLAAVPSFRYGDEPYTIQVTGFHGGKSNSVLVTVVSYCDCGPTVVDLSPHAFRQLAPLSVGRIRVIVDHVRGRAVPLAPATDVR